METRRSAIVISLAILNVIILVFVPSIISLHATASQEPFTINHRLVKDDSQIIVTGEIINNQSVSVTNVTVRITFLDGNQSIMKSYPATAWLEVILPGRRAPFRQVIEKQDVDGFAEYEVEVEQYDIYPNIRPFGLIIDEAHLILFPNATFVAGYITNNNTEGISLDNVIVMACFYDDKGFLTAESFILTFTEPLLPLDRTEFVISTKYVNQTANLKKYILTAESKVRPPHPGYSINEEMVLLVVPKQSDQSFDYRLIIPILIVMAMIGTGIYAHRKQKKRGRHAKKT